MRTNEDEERDAFFDEIGHDETVHELLSIDQLTVDDAPEHAAFTRHLVASRGNSGDAQWVPDSCGWWWCPRRGATPSWADLREAVRHLRRAGVDPAALEIAQLAELFGRVGAWSDEYEGYTDLWERLQMPTKDDAERLRLKWLDELQPLIANAKEIGGHADRQGRPRNVALRQAIAFGQERGWSASVVASALLLVGADRSDFASLKKKVDTMVRRSVIRAV